MAIWNRSLLNPATANIVASRFEKELEKRLRQQELERERNSSEAKRCADERSKLSDEAEKIVDAIASVGHSPALLERLKNVEAKIAQLQAIQAHKPRSVQAVATEGREFVMKSLMDTRELLYTSVQSVKHKLAQHVGRLTLTPTDAGDGFEVRGNWTLLPEQQRVNYVVARDGFEPPTPAFSGLRSTN